LNKNVSSDVLFEAIKQVLLGGLYISPDVATRLAEAVQNPHNQPLHHLLSDREDQVMRLLGAGGTVSLIAAQLRLSVKTVSTYRAIILRKLQLANNAQLMRYALEHGLGT
jgi:DNA-binding NarL/FixJ family response regulator